MAVVSQFPQKKPVNNDQSGLPPSATPPYDPPMTGMTREEMLAHLAASEARTDARVSRIEASTTGIMSEMQSVRASISSMKWWMIGTGLSVVLGIAAFNATVLGNMVASFEAGKNTASAVAERTAKQDEQIKKLDDLLSRAEKAATK